MNIRKLWTKKFYNIGPWAYLSEHCMMVPLLKGRLVDLKIYWPQLIKCFNYLMGLLKS
jgi:hypothetical protein